MELSRTIKKAMALALSASMFLATPVYAKDGPDDWYDSYESKSKYDVGDDCSDGYLVFINKNDNKNASLTIKRDGDVIWSESFWHNYIVKVEDDDIINAVGCYCIEYEDIEPWTLPSCEEGFFEVGEQIPAGTYTVQYVRGEDGDAFVRVWSDLVYSDNSDYKDYQVTKSMSRGKSYEIDLEEGYYVELFGCRLIND